MRQGDKELIRSSFEKVKPNTEALWLLFFGKLLVDHPELGPMFKSPETQGRVLVNALASIVLELDNFAELVPWLRDLGSRHARYGVIPDHYDFVGTALLWALRQVIGLEFNPDIERAWIVGYTVIASAMQAGAVTVSD